MEGFDWSGCGVAGWIGKVDAMGEGDKGGEGEGGSGVFTHTVCRRYVCEVFRGLSLLLFVRMVWVLWGFDGWVRVRVRERIRGILTSLCLHRLVFESTRVTCSSEP